ncbi:uncharacterized protein LOC121894010 [Thunnus maccoyii]|uniref:uncharacterized protein LOC121894010 n=1 Tax=Thunnus maccoyii TaxID=8240 RepID=UPI001C4BD344|nr:uncharacterized protein LOC121894010 [Thunnus maccoyii]XP_042262224.1 uncharacterized protein LOC121894010 [Thunnus maccoyii]
MLYAVTSCQAQSALCCLTQPPSKIDVAPIFSAAEWRDASDTRPVESDTLTRVAAISSSSRVGAGTWRSRTWWNLGVTESLDTQSHLYSQYKGRTTLKALIGVAPNGVITVASDLYGGSASDKAITADCGLLQHLQPDDMVMADKGFTIRDILPEGVLLNIPSFLVNGQFTQEEMNNNRLISRARIHVERSIQRLKLYSTTSHTSSGKTLTRY